MTREYTEDDSRQMKLPDARSGWRRACRFGRLFMFKSNCEGSHFFHWISFLTPRLAELANSANRVQRAASAKRAPWPIAALAPNALPNGVLVHRSSRLDPPVCVFTLAPPVPSQVLSLLRREGRLLLWLCTRPTTRTALQVCVCVATPLERDVRLSNGPTARTHATATHAP